MEIINNQKFIKVVANEGYVLTTYKDGDDIKDFSYFMEGAFPLAFDPSVLREITIEEALALEELANKATEE